LFLTLERPLSDSPVDVPMLFFTCTQARNAKTREELVGEIWRRFSSRRLEMNMFRNDVPNTLLTYYKNKDVEIDNASLVLAPNLENDALYGDGQCRAFFSIFQASLNAHGVEVELNAIDSKRSNELMLVRNWTFTDTPSNPEEDEYEYRYSNVIFSVFTDDDNGNGLSVANIREDNHSYNFFGTPDVSDAQGIPGQGVDNPYSDFGTHYNAIVDGKIYDPSYGVSFNGENVNKIYEEEAISALYKVEFIEDENGTRVAYMFIRKNNPNTDDLNFD
jgi:hypothetical protein